jgi:hypothetical protein
MMELPDQLTDKEIDTLILNFAHTHKDPFTAEEATKIVNWAEEVLINAMILHMVLEGLLGIDYKNGEVVVETTEYGKEMAETLISSDN